MLNKVFPAGLAFVVAAATGSAQAPPAFEVASIKPADMTKITGQVPIHVGMKVDAARVDIGLMSLRDLIMTAYRVKAFQITGPDWIASQRFDILATLPAGSSTEQVPEMLQALLAERFGLKVRHESKEMPIYALAAGKGGPKFKASPPDAEEPQPEAKPDGAMVIGIGDNQVRVKQAGRGNIQVTGSPNGPMQVTVGPGGVIHMEFQKVTLQRFAEMLTPMINRPVVDRTGLQGNYQIALDLAMQDMMQMARVAAAGSGLPIPPPQAMPNGGQAPAATDPSGGSIFQSVQQLGLKLEKDKAPFDTIVIEHLEKEPSEN